MDKKKFFTRSRILSIITLVLSILLISAFFMPVYKVETGYAAIPSITVNGIDLLQGANMTEEDVLRLSEKVMAGEIDQETAMKKMMAYSMSESDNTSYKIALISSIAVLLMGVIGLIVSIASLLKTGPATGSIVMGAFMTILSLLLIITAFMAVADFNEGEGAVKVGISSWFAIISSLAYLGCAITGKIFRRQDKQLSTKQAV